MKRRIFITGSLLFLLACSFLALSAHPSDVIVIEYADNFEANSLSGSATLLALLNNVADRIALQYSDSLRQLDISAPPSALNTLLTAVADRVAMQYADNVRHLNVVVIPAVLNTRLNEVVNRLAFQYADRNRRITLGYPAELIGDSTPPVIESSPNASFSGTTAVITWSTDEFTNYVLQYGTSSGTYTNQVSSSWFSQQHQAVVTGLTEEVYYYRIISTDLSGNTATSPEYMFEVGYMLSLPIIVR